MDKLINGLIEIIDLYTNKDFYIGQTNNPKIRIRQHKGSKEFKFMIVLYESSKEIIDILEYSLINKFKSYKNNMNNQTYEKNKKTFNIQTVEIPDIKKINELHYLYIAFPYLIKPLNHEFIDTLEIKNMNDKIKVISSMNKCYVRRKKSEIKKTPREICDSRIKKLISQYHFKYKFIKIRATEKNFKTFKELKENKNYMVKMIYSNSDPKLIKDLKKEYQNVEYEGVKNIKENSLKSFVTDLKKCDKLYIAFLN